MTVLDETGEIEAAADPPVSDPPTPGGTAAGAREPAPPSRGRRPDELTARLEEDFVELYRAHYHRVVRSLELGGLDRARSEDVAQEAFARMLGHWARVRTGANPPGYVYRTAFRLARRPLRREAPLVADVAALSDAADDVVTRTVVEAVVAAMPYRRRSCVVLCLVVGLSTKEAARALGIAEGTVRKQVERGRADLRLALRDRRR